MSGNPLCNKDFLPDLRSGTVAIVTMFGVAAKRNIVDACHGRRRPGSAEGALTIKNISSCRSTTRLACATARACDLHENKHPLLPVDSVGARYRLLRMSRAEIFCSIGVALVTCPITGGNEPTTARSGIDQQQLGGDSVTRAPAKPRTEQS
ncbi:hypothetical protein, partial [Xanthomonas maliensis]